MNHEGPQVEEIDGVVEIQYNSGGVLALEEGTEYSLGGDNFDVADSRELRAIEEGTKVYVPEDSDFLAYDLKEFTKILGEDSKETKTWYQNKKKPDNSVNSSSDGTKGFDTSRFDIKDEEEFVRMMKENLDYKWKEDVEAGENAEDTVTRMNALTKNMSKLYKRHVQDPVPEADETSVYDGTHSNKEGSVQKNSKRNTSTKLHGVEDELTGQGNSNDVDDYVDVEELLRGRQAEISDFRNKGSTQTADSDLRQGQSEISDW